MAFAFINLISIFNKWWTSFKHGQQSKELETERKYGSNFETTGNIFFSKMRNAIIEENVLQRLFQRTKKTGVERWRLSVWWTKKLEFIFWSFRGKGGGDEKKGKEKCVLLEFLKLREKK